MRARAFHPAHSFPPVLLDPPKRAIYDEYGVQGLRAGSELILASQGRNDMLDEYRRLMRQKDELLERRAFQPKVRCEVYGTGGALFTSVSRRRVR